MLYDDRRQGQDSASEYSASCIDIALARTAGCSPGAVPQPAANRPARAPSGPVMRPARCSPGCWPAPGPQGYPGGYRCACSQAAGRCLMSCCSYRRCRSCPSAGQARRCRPAMPVTTTAGMSPAAPWTRASRPPRQWPGTPRTDQRRRPADPPGGRRAAAAAPMSSTERAECGMSARFRNDLRCINMQPDQPLTGGVRSAQPQPTRRRPLARRRSRVLPGCANHQAVPAR